MKDLFHPLHCGSLRCHKYRLSDVIRDGTRTMNATLYDDVVTQLQVYKAYQVLRSFTTTKLVYLHQNEPSIIQIHRLTIL
ncbi:hypothetical protein QVD17_06728 [Tagetes erecta]|uniref:Uncharacterized protein n=1 Tax=Tagetes erecta TaxID=13708 RepID=A0AAD8P6S1_TARER|nr:hypothetical protein QVD17_06728 [Tagetes erecta]